MLLLIPTFSNVAESDASGKVFINLLLADASLWSCRPEERLSTSEPLPGRLKELTGKLRWMKWEPPPLFSEGRRSRMRLWRLCISSQMTQNALCDFIFYPSHGVQPHTLYPVRLKGFRDCFPYNVICGVHVRIYDYSLRTPE